MKFFIRFFQSHCLIICSFRRWRKCAVQRRIRFLSCIAPPRGIKVSVPLQTANCPETCLQIWFIMREGLVVWVSSLFSWIGGWLLEPMPSAQLIRKQRLPRPVQNLSSFHKNTSTIWDLFIYSRTTSREKVGFVYWDVRLRMFAKHYSRCRLIWRLLQSAAGKDLVTISLVIYNWQWIVYVALIIFTTNRKITSTFV